MKKLSTITVSLIILSVQSPAGAQTVETIDGIRVIHNEKAKALEGITLSLVRVMGGLDVEDENLAFGSPYDVDMDSTGNIYVLDYRNSRIQMFNGKGEFIRSIGRPGQGPGDFQSVFSFDIDTADNLHGIGGRRPGAALGHHIQPADDQGGAGIQRFRRGAG